MGSMFKFLSACSVCQQSCWQGPAICPDCQTILQRTSRCGEPSLQVFSRHWHKLRVLGAYEGLLGQLISQGKFNAQPHIFKHLAALFSAPLAEIICPADAVLVAVPMHWTRRLRRGFNQADIIASELSKTLGLVYQPELISHTGDPRVQHRLNRAERLRSRRSAFKLTGAVPERVFIVDDIVTTGATASAICQLLKAAGTTYIEVWALALTTK